MIFEQARGKTVLNLFCYTCAFSVFASLGGAAAVYSVDISNTYLEEGKRNFALNGIAADSDKSFPRRRAQFIRSDVEDFLLDAARKNQAWDIIILDPPTFSNSKKTHRTLDTNRDWARLVNLCLDALANGGALYFSTNSRRFKFDALLVHSANKRGCAVRFEEVTRHTISQDFEKKAPHRSWRFTLSGG
jgi:23S rRNA (cytosine1962-C5)-methyltransferase